MAVLVASFVARLLDPVALVICLIAAFVMRDSARPVQVMIGIAVSAVVTIAVTLLLCSMQMTCRSPFGADQTPGLSTGFFAAAAWYALFTAIFSWVRRRRH
jgi:hypothetical protein